MNICSNVQQRKHNSMEEIKMKKRFVLEGLGCASCASKMETAINKISGVKEATVNFMTQKLIIDADEDKMPVIVEESEKIIRKIEPDTRLVKA